MRVPFDFRVPLRVSDILVKEYTVKTVGSGKDFETLHEALSWAEKISGVGNGMIIFKLDDGVHKLGAEGSFDGTKPIYSIQNLYISIESSSQIEGNCIITIDGGSQTPAFIEVFRLIGSVIITYKITVDLAYDGYDVGATSLYFGRLFSTATFIMQSSTIKSVGQIMAQHASTIVFDNSTVDGFKSITMVNSNAIFMDTIVKNGTSSGGSIVAMYFSNVQLINATLTDNVKDTNIPLNEVQEDGSYIGDGSYLQPKPLSGDTASRPTVTRIGFRYFDTTLGKPIWWSGSEWVDATGTTA